MNPLSLLALLRARLSRAFYGWRIVAFSFVINAFHDGTYYVGTSIFFLPIGRDLGLSRTATSIPFTVNKIIPSILAPFVGLMIDRHGPARVLTASVFLSGLGWVLLSRADSFTAFLIVLVSVLSIGMMGWVSATTTAVNVWFRRRRSTAMSVAFTGFSAGGAIIPASLALGVSHLGWRTTMLATGLAVWAIVLPLATQIRRSPESMGLKPDGQPPVKTGASPAALDQPERDYTVREALKTRAFWMMTFSTALSGMVASAFALHMVAIMTSKGLDETTAGFMVGLLSVFMAPLVLITGWMGDRWPKQRISAASHVIRSGAFLLLLLWDPMSAWQMILVLLLLSPTEATWSLGYALLADIFGRRNLATLRGVMGTSVSVWTIGPPIVAGWVFDTTGSYNWLLGPFVVVTLMSAVLLWFVPGPKPLVTEGGRGAATGR